MNKLSLFALLWAIYLICATTIVVNTVLWAPAAMLTSGLLLGIGLGILIVGLLLWGFMAAIDCNND